MQLSHIDSGNCATVILHTFISSIDRLVHILNTQRCQPILIESLQRNHIAYDKQFNEYSGRENDVEYAVKQIKTYRDNCFSDVLKTSESFRDTIVIIICFPRISMRTCH